MDTPENLDTPESRLLADLDRLTRRLYSEEGIPMILVCENLVPDETAREPASGALASRNEGLISSFRQGLEALQGIQAEVALTDLAKLVEVLADRDFAAGGSTQDL